MVKIKVTRGACGISYVDEHGARRHATKTAKSGPFEYDDKKAARLVSLGVAEYVTPREKKGASSDISELSVKELIALAEEKGIDVSKCKKKAEYVTAITDASTEKSGHTDSKQEELLGMSIEQLEQMAAEMGIDTDDFEKKEEFAEAILTAMAEPGQNNNLPKD